MHWLRVIFSFEMQSLAIVLIRYFDVGIPDSRTIWLARLDELQRDVWSPDTPLTITTAAFSCVMIFWILKNIRTSLLIVSAFAKNGFG